MRVTKKSKISVKDAKSKCSRVKFAKRESNIYVEVVCTESSSQPVATMTKYESLVPRTVFNLIRRRYKKL